MSALSTPRVVPLSLDERLSRELQAELEAFIKAQPQARDLSFAVGVIANLTSGEILAAPEVNHRYADAPSSVLRSVNVGSAIKPLLAAATLTSLPELASLQIWNPGGRISELWGYPLSSDFETGGRCPVGWIDLRRFLECSSNVYSAMLVSAALQPRSNRRVALENRAGAAFRLNSREESNRQPRLPLEPDLAIHPESLFASALSHGLEDLFGVTTSLEEARVDHGDATVWEGLTDAAGKTVYVPSGLWPERSRVGLVLQGRRSTLRRLAAVAIGAGEARLTPIDLTQAFGRLVSDRTLVLRFVPVDTAPPPAPNHGLRAQRWYPTFIAGLRGVGETGTAAGTASIVRRVVGPNVVFLGKTGTLNSPGSSLRRVPDTSTSSGNVAVKRDDVVKVDPVVATTLVFAIGTMPRNGGAALSCGVVGTIYFRLNREVDRVDPLALAFANQRLWPVLRKHWSRLGVCPAAPRPNREPRARFTTAGR
jgi:cell division protein FtsI/penicillin-binding protein 2